MWPVFSLYRLGNRALDRISHFLLPQSVPCRCFFPQWQMDSNCTEMSSTTMFQGQQPLSLLTPHKLLHCPFSLSHSALSSKLWSCTWVQTSSHTYIPFMHSHHSYALGSYVGPLCSYSALGTLVHDMLILLFPLVDPELLQAAPEVLCTSQSQTLHNYLEVTVKV